MNKEDAPQYKHVTLVAQVRHMARTFQHEGDLNRRVTEEELTLQNRWCPWDDVLKGVKKLEEKWLTTSTGDKQVNTCFMSTFFQHCSVCNILFVPSLLFASNLVIAWKIVRHSDISESLSTLCSLLPIPAVTYCYCFITSLAATFWVYFFSLQDTSGPSCYCYYCYYYYYLLLLLSLLLLLLLLPRSCRCPC